MKSDTYIVDFSTPCKDRKSQFCLPYSIYVVVSRMVMSVVEHLRIGMLGAVECLRSLSPPRSLSQIWVPPVCLLEGLAKTCRWSKCFSWALLCFGVFIRLCAVELVKYYWIKHRTEIWNGSLSRQLVKSLVQVSCANMCYWMAESLGARRHKTPIHDVSQKAYLQI